MCFDIVNFYPSIIHNLLSRALIFASNFNGITSDEKDIIMHAKTSFIIHKDQPWEKKGASNFNVTMGSFDGAETCELLGSFLLSQLPKELEHNMGLYRDDGLAITNSTPRGTKPIKQSICHIFKKNDLRITIEANKHIINFLDVTFNLRKKTYQPYTKPNTTLQYVHNESNHPPLVIKNIPAGITKRLSSLSSNKACFNQAAPLYQKALRDCGYQHKLLYEPTEPTKKKNRKRNNILWYNPPYSKNVTNNSGHSFLPLIKKHFPTGNKLRKIFNRNTVKISYSCMSNTRQVINNHNKRFLQHNPQNVLPTIHPIKLLTNAPSKDKTCNCQQKDKCTLNGNCLQSSLIYQARVTRKDNHTTETYIGLTENDFKTRYRNHTASFRHPHPSNSAELRKHIRNVWDNDIDHSLSWRIITKAQPYSSTNKGCNLCLKEKLVIIRHPYLSSLNKCNKLVSSSRHRNKALPRNN